MKQPTKDLFDDTTMTFGEHLEVLRTHLIRAIIGLVIAVVICLYKGDVIVDFIRRPIDKALKQYSQFDITDDTRAMKSGWEKLKSDWGIDTLKEVVFGSPEEAQEAPGDVNQGLSPHHDTIAVAVSVDDLARALHQTDPQRFPEKPVPPAAPGNPSVTAGQSPAEVTLRLRAPEFAELQATIEQSRQAVTLKIEEAFLTYVKVSLIAGFVFSSPWIFYQLWLFVAAGLYPHERKYVYVYGTMSLVLFLAGAIFCFYAVFPFVLKFLLSFNSALEIHPQIRLSEWISFAVMLPLMFGISFELPLVMLFLERISIFEVSVYTEQRRMAILVIAILSALLTPADPMSMLLMMFPLIFLYQLGIWLCKWLPKAKAFDDAAA